MAATGCAIHPCTKAGCPGCQRVSRMYDRRRRAMIAAGTWQWNRPAAEVQAHIDMLVEAGMTLGGISRASGVSRRTVQGVKQRNYLQGVTAAAILAVTPQGRQGRAGEVPAKGVSRRIQCLMALGWTLAAQGRELGMPTQTVWEYAWEKQSFVSVVTRDRVYRMFERLCATPGGSTRAVNAARRHGWLPPLAWDDLDAADGLSNIEGAASAVIDEVAIDRSLAGERIELTNDELLAAVQIGNSRGMPVWLLAERLHMRMSGVQNLLNGELPPRRAKAAARQVA
jgi:lambda repressor-like predicted transcriptional regulator